jgi:plasmid stabilization system protein ParE
MKCAFHPDARLEYRAAAEFYEARQVGLGAAFTKEIETAIEHILEAPERFRFIEQDVRRCLARTFPYGVLYTVERDLVLILAIAHGSREPGYWQDRLLPGGSHR